MWKHHETQKFQNPHARLGNIKRVYLRALCHNWDSCVSWEDVRSLGTFKDNFEVEDVFSRWKKDCLIKCLALNLE